MKKDLLFGLSGKKSTVIGIILYLLSRLVGGEDILIITIVAMFEIAGIWLFVGGLFRWNKEVKQAKNRGHKNT